MRLLAAGRGRMTAQPRIDARQFRQALGNFTTGVTIVTTRDDDTHDIGLTANSFNSVSLDPPMVLWSLAKSSLSLHAFVQAEYFAVHILSAQQQTLSERFAKRGVDKFAGLEIGRGVGGIPLLEGCAARFECRTAFRHEGGDHEIFVGEVLHFDQFDCAPLVFHSGRYALVVKPAAPPTPATSEDRVQEGSFSRDFLGYLLGSAYHLLLAPIRDELRRRGLSETQYYLLGILGADGDRLRSEVAPMLTFAGMQLTDAVMAETQSRGLVQVQGDMLRLTDAGRRNMIELMAIGKGAEADTERELDYSEAQLLKQLLWRMIRRRSRGLPPLWRKRHEPRRPQ
jgi:3-hydroxy-9,10-secoandrosta-1,3,5(10)-triene-9,17-dione monooxygenase reductase component